MSDDDDLAAYEQLRQQELEHLQNRHKADVELQKVRFKIAHIAMNLLGSKDPDRLRSW